MFASPSLQQDWPLGVLPNVCKCKPRLDLQAAAGYPQTQDWSFAGYGDDQQQCWGYCYWYPTTYCVQDATQWVDEVPPVADVDLPDAVADADPERPLSFAEPLPFQSWLSLQAYVSRITSVAKELLTIGVDQVNYSRNLKMKVSRVVQAAFCMKSLVATVLRLSSGEETTKLYKRNTYLEYQLRGEATGIDERTKRSSGRDQQVNWQ